MRCDACCKDVTHSAWLASVITLDLGTGQRFVLCKECAMAVSFNIQACIKAIRKGGAK